MDFYFIVNRIDISVMFIILNCVFHLGHADLDPQNILRTYKTESNSRLIHGNELITVTTTQEKLGCVFLCLTTSTCTSINIEPVTSSRRTRTCHLMRDVRSGSNMEAAAGWEFIGLPFKHIFAFYAFLVDLCISRTVGK